ncbi:MAG: alkaline phosphatase family protein [candidate division WOR-3 bacterium]
MFILGLDGVPFSFLKNYTEKRNLPFLKSLFNEGDFKRMESVYPTLSSVAWTSFLTGKKPGSHGIFGFIDIHDDLSLYIPNYKDIKTKTLLEIFSENKRSVLHINLPITYPPPDIKNTYCISGFIAPKIEKATYPQELNKLLIKENYIIDLDPWMAREEKKREDFYNKLFLATEKRFKVCEEIMKKNYFDIIILHIMEPDRLFHFFIKEDNKLEKYFHFLDEKIKEFVERNVKDEDELILLSDHGFTELKSEINIFPLLKNRGIFKFKIENSQELKDISEDSKAFTMTPGRIYLYKKERFLKAKYKEEEIIKEVENILKDLLNLEGIKDFKSKYEIFGKEFSNIAPDFLLISEKGFDFRAELKNEEIYMTSPLKGTHTFDDAFLFIRGKRILKDNVKIIDVAPTILNILEISNKYNFDGEVIV